MIVPMKKVWIAATLSHKQQTLKSLADLGIVHLEESFPQSQDLEKARIEHSQLESLVMFLEEYAPQNKTEAKPARPETVTRLIEIREEMEQLAQQRQDLLQLRESTSPWGNFDPKGIKPLEASGLYPRVYSLDVQQQATFPGSSKSIVLSKNKEKLTLLILQDAPEAFKGFEFLPFPAKSLSEIDSEISGCLKKRKALLSDLEELAKTLPSLREMKEKAKWTIGWESAYASAGNEEDLVYWTGYIPKGTQENLRKSAQDAGFGFGIADPGEDDAVPTLVKNPIVPGMVKPLFNLLGTVPGYRERDISLPFLAYFIVFFSILVGDAGYGLLFLSLGLGMVFSDLLKKRTPGDIGVLLTFLSVGTVVWGALTGTWFGNLIELSQGQLREFLRFFAVRPFVDENYQTSIAFVKWFVFTLGVTHLSIGHIWNIFRLLFKDKNFLKALAQVGALGTTLALYPIVLTLVISPAEVAQLPEAISKLNAGTLFALWPENIMYNLYAAFGGVGFVILFGSQEGNLLKGLLSGFANILNTLLGAISWFSDNISYIRLFAVSLAGFAIASSFNTMALGVMAMLSTSMPGLAGSTLGFVAGSLILLAGHSLNLAMALLGVIVHGVRLNLLEFSGRVGIEWSGFEYQPLRAYKENR